MITRSSFECSTMETSRQQNSQRYQQEISHFSRCRKSKQGIHDEFPPKQRDCRQVFLHSFYAIKMSYFLNRKINDGVVFTFLLYVWDLCAKKSSRDGKSLESSLKSLDRVSVGSTFSMFAQQIVAKCWQFIMHHVSSEK